MLNKVLRQIANTSLAIGGVMLLPVVVAWFGYAMVFFQLIIHTRLDWMPAPNPFLIRYPLVMKIGAWILAAGGVACIGDRLTRMDSTEGTKYGKRGCRVSLRSAFLFLTLGIVLFEIFREDGRGWIPILLYVAMGVAFAFKRTLPPIALPLTQRCIVGISIMALGAAGFGYAQYQALVITFHKPIGAFHNHLHVIEELSKLTSFFPLATFVMILGSLLCGNKQRGHSTYFHKR